MNTTSVRDANGSKYLRLHGKPSPSFRILQHRCQPGCGRTRPRRWPVYETIQPNLARTGSRSALEIRSRYCSDRDRCRLPIVAEATTSSITYGTLTTQLYVLYGAVLGFVKDQMTPPDFATVESEVAGYMNLVTNHLEGAVAFVVNNTFNQPDVLGPFIQNGTWFTSGKNVTSATSYDVSQSVQAAVYANSLPVAWQTGTTLETVFVATGTGVGNSGKSDPWVK